METKFTPIAMRCNKKQFEAIKPKLEKAGVKASGLSDFGIMPYLINNRFGIKNSVTNYSNRKNWKIEGIEKKHVYNEWDEATFLRACGIEVDEPITVSKEFILEAHNSACSTWKRKLEEKFPSVFVKDELEVGKWYKKVWNDGDIDLFFAESIDKDFVYFGENYFRNGKKLEQTSFKNNIKHLMKDDRQTISLATTEEVETALINEAKKRGLYGNISIITPYDGTERKLKDNGADFTYFENKDGGYLTYYGWRIFQNGKWATIIEQPTEMTVAEIEQKLGLKIKIVG